MEKKEFGSISHGIEKALADLHTILYCFDACENYSAVPPESYHKFDARRINK
jgi:hypothetical protein